MAPSCKGAFGKKIPSISCVEISASVLTPLCKTCFGRLPFESTISAPTLFLDIFCSARIISAMHRSADSVPGTLSFAEIISFSIVLSVCESQRLFLISTLNIISINAERISKKYR